MTSRLVIDDLRVFPFDAVYARDSSDGFALLDGRPWDEIWFDHDLGEHDTTMPIVDMLCEQAHNGTPYPVGRIMVHTANPPARRQIMASLARYGYEPEAVYAEDHGGRVPSKTEQRRGILR